MWVGAHRAHHHSYDCLNSPLPLCAFVDAVPGPSQPPAQRAQRRVSQASGGPQLAQLLQPGGVGTEKVDKAQVANFLHLAQGGAQLLRWLAVQPALQLSRHRRPVAETRGEHEGEAEARAVLRVELLQLLPLFCAQACQARAALFPLRFGSERAPLLLVTRQVRVAAQDALLS